MKNYERPLVLVTDELAEGIYMSSGGEIPLTKEGIQSALEYQEEKALGENGAQEGVTSPSAILGDTDQNNGANTDQNGDNQPADEPPETTETPETTPDLPEENGDQGENAASADNSEDPLVEETTEGVASGEVPANSNGLGCQSIYMRGVWQDRMVESGYASQGISFKDKFGCAGCSKSRPDGCQLISDYIATGHGATFRNEDEMMRMKPSWEQEGHSGDEIWKNTMPTY